MWNDGNNKTKELLKKYKKETRKWQKKLVKKRKIIFKI